MPYLYKYDKNLIASEMYAESNTYDSLVAFRWLFALVSRLKHPRKKFFRNEMRKKHDIV